MGNDNNRNIAIQRAECYSPNSVAKDLAILQSAGDRLRARGFAVEYLSEGDLANGVLPAAQGYLSMARSPHVLDMLKQAEEAGRLVLNSTQGVEACTRSRVDRALRGLDSPLVPPLRGENGYWLKRGDASAQTEDDVVFCNDEEELEKAKQTFARRGISDYVVSAHVEGDLVKFYGVRGQKGFFFYCYPNDNGSMKFGDERRNGKPHHYHFDVAQLHTDAFSVADVTSTDFFGGDAIVRPDGTYVIIDFNDWPSFSACREEAAEAIAEHFVDMIDQKQDKANDGMG